MRLFIDDADAGEIRRLLDLYPIDGVTTNPSILAKAGGDPVRVLLKIREIIGEERLLFAQAIPRDAEGMAEDARALRRLLGENTAVKVPVVPEGLRAIRIMREEGITACGTVVYTPLQGASSQLNWDYQSFSPLGRKMFPDDMKITLTTASKEVKMELKLNYLGNDSDWETRTQVSAKYNEVTVDEILRRFMAL